MLYHVQGQFAKAEPLYKRSLAILEKVLGPDHPAVAMKLEHMSDLYWDMGQENTAEELEQRAAAIRAIHR